MRQCRKPLDQPPEPFPGLFTALINELFVTLAQLLGVSPPVTGPGWKDPKKIFPEARRSFIKADRQPDS
jgi:hypothetical protein